MSYFYKTMESPLGQLVLVASEKGLAGILWEHDDPRRVRLNPRTQAKSNPILVETEKQLNEYLPEREKPSP